MANFTENNLLYHIFSKSPVSDATTLAQSLNKSGHTLTTDDIFGEELPAFYDVANTTERNDLTAYNNDVCKIGNNFYYYTLKEDGSYGWLDRSAIADGECLFNRSSEYKNNGTDWKNNTEGAVVKYHENKDGEFITKDNNGVNGNKFTVRVKKSDGNYIKQFISVTDKIVNSRTSNGYAPLVLQSGSVMEENAKYKDASSDNQRYIANCYAGIIQFPVQKTGTTVASNIKISVWEYIGKTLTDVLKGFATVDSGFNYRVADSYPAPSADLKGWVYLIPASKEEDNNIYNEFICVDDENGNWKWEQIGSTAITLPAAGAHLKLENDTYSVKTSTKIEDNDDTVPTTAAVFSHTNNSTIHVTQEDRDRWDGKSNIKVSSEIIDDPDSVPTTQAVYNHVIDDEVHLLSTQISGTGTDGQTTVGESCHGFILKVKENAKIERIVILQVNGGGQVWRNDVYCKISDPITDREFISPKFSGSSFLPLSSIYFVKNGQKQVDEIPYLVKGREYKLTFWSSTDNSPVSLNIPYIEPRQTPNALFGSFITHKILSNNEVVECSYPNVPVQTGIQNAFKAAGYAIMPVARRCYNEHILDLANEVANIYDALGTDEQNLDVSDHINDTDIHFSKSLISDKYYQDAGVKDLTQMGTSTADVQGIAYTQICADTYAFGKNSFLTSVKVPQENYNATDYTNDDVYLVIYGDTTGKGDGDWVFVASSKNSLLQEAGGNDMIFEFEKGIDLGDYKRCRFFYSLTNEGEIPLPTTGENYNGVKMAFKAIVIDANCWIKQTNSTGSVIYNRAFPAIISYATEESILHKDNHVIHITQEERDRWNNNTSSPSSSNISISKNLATTLANQKSVYGHIANDGVLSLGVVSANNNTMGVSKLFTGELAPAPSGAEDTAVSVKSIQDMYNALASLINNITTTNLPEYNKKIEELEGVIKSNNETITNLTNLITVMQNNIVILDNINNGSYDVSRANQNTAPDGSEWNEIVHDANNLKINYITYDDTNNLGMMYGTIGDN